MAIKIDFNSQIWKEGKMYVAYVPQLDISSCGETREKAKKKSPRSSRRIFGRTAGITREKYFELLQKIKK